MGSLKGKTAVVTGSTSGIGLAIARAFAGAGANIVINGMGAPADIERERSGIETDFKVRAVYSPAESVITVRVAPVPVCVSVTVAPGTTAPVSSVTTPRIVPVTACAASEIGRRRHAAIRISTLFTFASTRRSHGARYETTASCAAPRCIEISCAAATTAFAVLLPTSTRGIRSVGPATLMAATTSP